MALRAMRLVGRAIATMNHSVVLIIRGRTVSQIAKAIVRWIAIKVAYLHSDRTLANESGCHQPMDVELCPLSILVKMN